MPCDRFSGVVLHGGVMARSLNGSEDWLVFLSLDTVFALGKAYAPRNNKLKCTTMVNYKYYCHFTLVMQKIVM